RVGGLADRDVVRARRVEPDAERLQAGGVVVAELGDGRGLAGAGADELGPGHGRVTLLAELGAEAWPVLAVVAAALALVPVHVVRHGRAGLGRPAGGGRRRGRRAAVRARRGVGGAAAGLGPGARPDGAGRLVPAQRVVVGSVEAAVVRPVGRVHVGHDDLGRRLLLED